MFGKRKTKGKKMQIWVEFSDPCHISDFQSRLSQTFDFYIVEKVETYTYNFIIKDYEYPIFMETLNDHWDSLSFCSTNIVKIK